MTLANPHFDEPHKFIRRCVLSKRVLWTYHANMRLKGKFITRRAIVESCLNYQIIERYPSDKYFPGYLVRSEFEVGRPNWPGSFSQFPAPWTPA